ncbi:hypothetical protein THIOSC15_1780005 [uncultured Thiomicrorhabdus sp.]
MRKWSNQSADVLESPISPSDLADFMGLDYEASLDSLLNSFLLSSCEMVIKYTNHDLLSRDYVYKLKNVNEYKLSVTPSRIDCDVELPIKPISSIASVTADGETVTPDIAEGIYPICFTQCGEVIEVSYTAGYATDDLIPDTLKTAIKMMASYLYEHRGECSYLM